MAVFKCKMCGGSVTYQPGDSVGICDFCGTKQTLPRLDDERRANLYDRANHYRRNNEFDKAEGIFEQILSEDITDAEAYWSLVLCGYGIEYVRDPATGRQVPTVNRVQYTSVLDDENYKAALRYADTSQRAVYEAEAKAIADIQKNYLSISQKEQPFDVFICYKETDDNGNRTPDSVLAGELYHALTDEGYHVFFSRVTLEDKLGSDYEPHIFAALNSAKVMVVLGTKAEHFNAVWVKNEWSRYLALIKQSGGKKVLIPAYRDMDPYDLPDEFSHLQALDMAKLGFMQDLIRGIHKIESADKPEKPVNETITINANANVAPLLKRAYIFLEDEEWRKSDRYFEKVLDLDPENAQAHLGKLMAELHVRRQTDLPNLEKPFDQNKNYQRAVRFGSEQLVKTLTAYLSQINARIENERQKDIYESALDAMDAAEDEASFQWAAKAFKSVSGFQDADALAETCRNQAEACRKDAIYARAKYQMMCDDIGRYIAAIKIFGTISPWKDADEQIALCEKKIEEIKAKEEAQRLQKMRQAEQQCANAQKREKIAIRIFVVFIFVVLATCVGLFIAGIVLTLQQQKKADDLLRAGQYDEAYQLLDELGNHDAIRASKKERGLALIKSGDYEQAYKLLNEAGNDEEIAKSKYERADALIKKGDYEQAYFLLDGLAYKDSANKRKQIKFQFEKAQIAKAEVGLIVRFGAYEQDNNTENGKEEIEWKVLKMEGDRVLLISRYALDCQPANERDTDTTWETCTLRAWLNKDFAQEAFAAEEISLIAESAVKAETNAYGINPGGDTVDKIFLLNINEVNQYYNSQNVRENLGTAYCFARGAKKEYKNSCACWLRSPGYTSKYFADYDNLGISNFGQYVTEKRAVRPVLWVNTGD